MGRYEQLEGGSSSSVDNGQQMLPTAPQVSPAELSTTSRTGKTLRFITGTVVVIPLAGFALAIFIVWLLFERSPDEPRQGVPTLAPSDMVNVEDLPPEMLANVPDSIGRNFAFCATVVPSALDLGIEERVPLCGVEPEITDDDRLMSVYYLNTAEQVKRAFAENDDTYNDDYAEWITRVYPKGAEKHTIAVHMPSLGYDPAYVPQYYLVKYLAPDQAIVYEFKGGWAKELTDFLEKYDLADQSIRDRIIAEVVNLENMPEQMIANIPEGIKQKLAYCSTDGYCRALNRDAYIEGFKEVRYLNTAEQVESAFSNYAWVYPKGAEKHTIALYTRVEKRRPFRPWDAYYLVEYIAPDQALVYCYKFTSKKAFVEMLEKHELVDQAIIDQIAVDLP